MSEAKKRVLVFAGMTIAAWGHLLGLPRVVVCGSGLASRAIDNFRAAKDVGDGDA